MKNYLLKIAYDGTDFGGWQVQPNAPTIQDEIQKALKILFKRDVNLTGQGRTDSGVHALAQAAHFHAEEELDSKKFLKSLNGLLPHAIRILDMEQVPLDFHARFSAIGKTYHYYVTTDPIILPFDRPYRAHIMGPFDLEKAQRAATLFVGTHDFTSFSNEAHRGSASKDPVRTLKRLDLIPEPSGFRVELEADGFLYKMCRNIVGTLIACGKNRLEIEEIPTLFSLKDRKEADMAAPAQGLFLIKVDYPTSSV